MESQEAVAKPVVAPSYFNDMATTTYGDDSARGVGAEGCRPINGFLLSDNNGLSSDAVEVSTLEGMADRQLEGPAQAFPMVGYANTMGVNPTDDYDLDRLEIEMKEKIAIAKGAEVNSERAVRRTDPPVEGAIQEQRVEEDVAGDLVSHGEGHGREEEDDSVKVVVRIRPPLDRELNGYHTYAPATALDTSGKTVTLSENLHAAANGGVENGIVYNTYKFGFDRAFGPGSDQIQVYNESARDVVAKVLQGYNGSIIAYGQTGAGKTHTMTGDLDGEQRGIIPRAVDDVFQHIVHDIGTEQCNYLVRASYLQIYNEIVSDLLKPENKNLMIREDKKRGVYVEGLSEWVVRTPSDVYDLMQRGENARMTGATRLNEVSSRSHAIFIIVVEKSSLEQQQENSSARPWEMRSESESDAGIMMGEDRGALQPVRFGTKRTVRMGKLNLVDLAGSERVHLTGAKGTRLEESKKINQSLSALGNVIGALTDPKRRRIKAHIPYRDSKLTRILEDSLGGNCKTTFVAVISPAVESFSESLSTLKFAHRAKRVKNEPRVNEDENHRTLLKKYERELKRLRAELQQRSKDLVDRRLLLELEEARRKEQADKIAAITALERQSAEIARQKAAMASLQNRISSMQSQLLVGGQSVQDTPAFRNLLAREQTRIREEYEKRLFELEEERRAVAEDKAATERLKGLLLKQRDVMVALTKRLGERDKEVLELQSKLEATEKKLKDAEDALDNRTAQLISIRKRLASITLSRDSKSESGALEVSYQLDTSQEGESNPVTGAWEKAQGNQSNAPGPMEVTAELSSKNSEEDEDESNGKENISHASPQKAFQTNFPQSSEKGKEEAWLSERDALKTILELKVLSLISNVESSIGSMDVKQDDRSKVLRQLNHVKKLVLATVTAMETLPT
eukprot:jgi/Picsp_1/4572/NSC_01942-R1_protein